MTRRGGFAHTLLAVDCELKLPTVELGDLFSEAFKAQNNMLT